MDLVAEIEALWDGESADPRPVEQALALLDAGEIRVAEKRDGEWVDGVLFGLVEEDLGPS